ncbi:glycosyltransferase family 2 protein [Pseudocitrobacter faecalis]|uniref:glycosyltransferase family 2 protein n=1 Tax=Pseudocitrobacter faecalis TaxID=1398493 RepID=UPI00389A1FB6
MNIEIALSVLNKGIDKIKFRNDYQYLVIHQISDGGDYSDSIRKLPENVRYIFSSEIGLSKSRNLAIKHARAKYIWIMDDDVEIRDDAKEYIKELADKNSDAPLLVVSHTLNNMQKDKVEKIRKLNIVTASCICSIDMIINVTKIENIRFDTDFGLGARYPSGEEYIFACNLIHSGHKVIKSNKICSYHPDDIGNVYPSKNALKTKKNMFIRANDTFIGYLLFGAFIVKSLFK